MDKPTDIWMGYGLNELRLDRFVYGWQHERTVKHGCNKCFFSAQRNKLLIIFSNAQVTLKLNPAISLNWVDNYLNKYENETTFSSDLIIFSVAFSRVYITFSQYCCHIAYSPSRKYNVGCELITAVNLPGLRTHVLEPQCFSTHSRQTAVRFHTL